jgi:hypothetical protein
VTDATRSSGSSAHSRLHGRQTDPTLDRADARDIARCAWFLPRRCFFRIRFRLQQVVSGLVQQSHEVVELAKSHVGASTQDPSTTEAKRPVTVEGAVEARVI